MRAQLEAGAPFSPTYAMGSDSPNAQMSVVAAACSYPAPFINLKVPLANRKRIVN